jgi:hypothetical protein
MPIATQNLSIPLGAGLDEGQDPRRLAPPNALRADNAVVRQGGAYRKAPGWSDLDLPNIGVDGARVLVSGFQDQLLACGQDNNSTYVRSLSSWDTYNDGWVPPVGVSTIPTFPLRGQILSIGIAHHQASELTAVFARHFDGCVAAILTDEGDIVSGPWTIPDITEFPRVEACTAGDGDAVFVFFGTDSRGAGNLRYFIIDAGSLPPTAPSTTPLAAYSEPDAHLTSKGSLRFVYDTCSVSSHDSVYFAFFNGGGLAAGRITSAGAVAASGVVKAGTPEAYRIFHDEVSETVLVSESGTWDSMFYANESLSSWTEVTGIHAETDPAIYKTAAGIIFFSGEQINLTGSAPAVPSFTGTALYSVAGLVERQPQPWVGNTRAMFFQRRDGGTVFGGAGGSVVGFRTVFAEGTRLGAMLIHSDGEPYQAVPVLQSLHGTAVSDGFLNAFGPGVGTPQQSALRADGSVLLAEHAKVSAAKATVEERKVGQSDEDYTEAHGENMDHQVYVVRISPNQEDVVTSSLQIGGTSAVAMGGVHLWDGQVIFDVPGPPLVQSYVDSTPNGTGTATGVNRSDETEIEDDSGSNYSNIRFWALRVVLVFVDRFGNEWRSAPSPIYTLDGIDGNVSVTDLPRVNITLDDSHRRVLDQGGSYDVELYVTERDEGIPSTGPVGAATEDEIIYNFWLAQRTPLLEDSSGYFVPDYLKCAASEANANKPKRRRPIPLYTDSGELPSSPLPACGQIASAGNYCFLQPSERPFDLLPSKPLVVGIGPEFPPELMIRAPAASGGIISMAGQGDRLVLLCRNGIYELYAGSGPDATGSGGFGTIRQVQLGDGCVNARATVSTPVGVFYAAASGIKLVAGGGGVESVGRAVQTTLADPTTILAATYREADREVWWLVDENTSVVLNIESGVWTTVTRPQGRAASAALSGGKIHHLSTNSSVYYEDDTQGRDNSAFVSDYSLDVTSPWLSFGKHTSWFRARRIFLHGIAYSGLGHITVELSYDYDDTVIDTFVETYDVDSEPDKKLHIRFRPSRQKFDAIKIRIFDDGNIVGESGASTDLRWSLTGLEIEVAAKKGGIKLSAEVSH